MTDTAFIFYLLRLLWARKQCPPKFSGRIKLFSSRVFAHGSGSSRHSPRNQFVARVIRESRNGTLLFDLLTAEEEIEGLRFRLIN